MMNDNCLLRAVSTTAVCLGLVFPADTLWGAELTDTYRVSAETKRPAIVDIKLASGGVLRGRVVDAQGIGARRVGVLVKQAGNELAKTETDQRGDFAIHGLHGGVYQVVARHTGRVVRAWAPKTAPPAARDGVLVVAGQDVVLGQRHAGPIGRFWENVKYPLTNPLVVGGIVALAVGIPVAVSNRDKGSGS